MSKLLHELIAAEEDLKGVHNKILLETASVFNNKASHFEEKITVFDGNQEGDEDSVVEQHTPMITTVAARLNYQGQESSKYLDALLQKESANAEAKADIILSGDKVVAKDVPVSALLGLERELKQVRKTYNGIPTLDPEKLWEKDESKGKDIVRNIAPAKGRTKKVTEPLTLAPATDRHPAQVQLINKDVSVGKLRTTVHSSKYTSARKHEILRRIDQLLTATKQARMRANMQEVKAANIGSKLFNFINEGNLK